MNQQPAWYAIDPYKTSKRKIDDYSKTTSTAASVGDDTNRCPPYSNGCSARRHTVRAQDDSKMILE